MAASPQCENGFTRFSNELLEQAYRSKLSDSEWRVWLAIARLCYGYHKCRTPISLSRLEQQTCLSRQLVVRATLRLEERLMITIDRDGYVNTIGIQKDYEQWQDSQTVLTSKKEVTSQTRLPKTSQKGVTTLKKKETLFDESSVQYRLADLLRQQMIANNPKAKVPDNGSMQRWCETVDLMIRRDDRTPEEIERVIKWCQANDFWRTNILGPDKLRKQFDQLWLKMGGEPKRNGCANANAPYPRSEMTLSTLATCPCELCQQELKRRSP